MSRRDWLSASLDHAKRALDQPQPRNLRRYPSVQAADGPLCEECNDAGEVEQNIDGCDVMVKCNHCGPSPYFYSTANAWQDRDADEAGQPAYGEL